VLENPGFETVQGHFELRAEKRLRFDLNTGGALRGETEGKR
jgi:hypothetical protein